MYSAVSGWKVIRGRIRTILSPSKNRRIHLQVTVCHMLLISSKELILPDSTAISVLFSLDSLSIPRLTTWFGRQSTTEVTNAYIHFLVFVLRSLNPCWATRCWNWIQITQSPYSTLLCVNRRGTSPLIDTVQTGRQADICGNDWDRGLWQWC